MKYIIYDVDDKKVAEILNTFNSKTTSVIDISKPMAKCVGCFHCWLKVPGECKFKDKIRYIGKELITSEETIFICKSLYGGFSVNVKRLIDRCIPGVMPFFRKENKELHHTKRYKTKSDFKIVFYNGDEVSEEEKIHAKDLMQKMSTNYHADLKEVVFTNNLSEAVKKVKQWKS
ncbi:MAG: hypothetical protein ACRC4M_02840 [Mycoplasma sp.]